ncbi:MAG TPA: hypothetical protein VN680_17535 [Burkholderiaceae bacterium]|jgi:hypothetical protein|nr:hypothetical protein [Burkholderiaceae bacterium]
MSCVDGATFQCSGDTIIRTENTVALTTSGVQAYAKSTSDLLTPNPNTTTAFGFTPASGGTAEVRMQRAPAPAGTVTRAAVILSNLGISWDGKVERPKIVEAFDPTQGVTRLGANGALDTTSLALPDPNTFTFYDFASKGTAATQANYANNRYFPRTAPARCPPPLTTCPALEVAAGDVLTFNPGDFRTNGTDPDRTTAKRLHSDGDIHAGNASLNTPFPDASGVGIPFAGNKGYRNLQNFTYDFSNLTAWVSEDTTMVNEWANAHDEHTVNRRGVVAFGATTDPTTVPTTGVASYTGVTYGWYAKNGTDDAVFYRGSATATVNFATRQVTIQISGANGLDTPPTPVPLTLTLTAGFGAAGSNVTNYMTGPVNTSDAAALVGGVGGRFFGPVAAGKSGTGPQEIAGTFSMKNATTNVSSVGGFIGRRQ